MATETTHVSASASASGSFDLAVEEPRRVQLDITISGGTGDYAAVGWGTVTAYDASHAGVSIVDAGTITTGQARYLVDLGIIYIPRIRISWANNNGTITIISRLTEV